MAAASSRQPAVVGVGQVVQRSDKPSEACEPMQLMVDALRMAADDAAASGLLEALELVVVVRGAWSYPDPARLVAEAVGAHSARTAITAEGGNSPQAAINHLCRLVASGELEVAALVGGEAIHARRRARQSGIRLAVTSQPDAAPDERLGDDAKMSSDEDRAAGLEAPVAYYALFEDALRTKAGRSPDEHRTRIARLLCGANAVAAQNPWSWSQRRFSAAEIQDVTDDNRMVAYPYTKRMCSNWFTNQAAAVIICSAAAARRFGVAAERMVYPSAGTEAHDAMLVVNRPSMHGSVAIGVAGTMALDLAGVTPDDLSFVDLYSCFPSAVQVAATELDVSLERDWTVTGGMAYFGGPLSNYVTHSVATMVERLRDHGGTGLVTANGGYLTKHSFGVYAADPPASGFRYADAQAEVDEIRPIEAAWGHVGAGTVEASTVLFGERPTLVAACLTRDGRRLLARSADRALVDRAMTEELAGVAVIVDGEGALRLPR